MKRTRCIWVLSGAVLVLAGIPSAASGQSNICNAGDLLCTIETRTDNLALHACNDGADNDGNGYTDAADPHCQSEVLCQDAIDNDSGGGTDGADLDCQCIRQIIGGNPPCTAGDISVAYTASPIVSDGCINTSDDTIVAQLTAEVTAHTPDRYDIGMWVMLAGDPGETALDGNVCTHDILQPVAIAPTLPDPTDPNGDGPFRNNDGDVCGDGGSNGSVSLYIFPYQATLPCNDSFIPSGGQGGFVDIGQCGSWDNNANTACANPTQAVPGTGSKCRCEQADTPIPGPNVRTVCTNFNTPSGLGGNGQLDFGETASFSLAYTNAVASCTPGAPLGADIYGRARCGTASFVRYAIDYTAGANTRGYFTYTGTNANCADGVGGVDTGSACIPDCAGTPVEYPTVNGVLCNDYANNRLIWAPRDVNTSNTYGVISAFAGTQSLPFGFTLTDAVGTTAINFNARIYWDDVLDSPPTPINGITAAEAIDLSGALIQTCTDCSCGTQLQTTPITLASFRATEGGRGRVELDWTTATEVGNVGFDLYAIVDGERVKLNGEPVPARGADSLEPQSYSATFAVPEGATAFEIVDIDLRGRERRHGPFELAKGYGARIETESIDWNPIRREHGVSTRAQDVGVARVGALLSDAAIPSGGPQAPASSIDLLVDETGLHRVTYDDFRAAGIDLAGVKSSQLALSADGVAVPMYVSTDGAFGAGHFVEFYGEALDTIYTRTNVYRLKTNQKRPARATVSNELPAGAAPGFYTETRWFERNRDYSFTSPSPDPFIDTRMLVFTTPGTWQFPFTIDGLAPKGQAPQIRVEVFGGSALPFDPDHALEVRVNGVLVGSTTFDDYDGATVEATLPDGLLVEGSNTLQLRMPANTGAQFSIVFFDRFSVTYPRWMSAVDGRLDFAAGAPRLEVSGLPSADVVAYRRFGKGLTRLAQAQAVPDGGSYRAIVPGSDGVFEYSVGSVGSLLEPQIRRSRSVPASLRSGAAEYLVITHSSFAGGLADLVAARQAQFQVKVVDVEDVYADFGRGIFGAQAIRDYVAFAHAQLGTRYVLLVGGDSYDYLNYLGLGAVSFVPSPYAGTNEAVRHAPADSVYADVDGDGVQDLAIGRFPVRTAADLAAVVAKTLEYDAKAYGGTAVLSADFSDASANQPFSHVSEAIQNELPHDWAVDRIYLDDTPLAAARTELFGAFDLGTALVNYVGHSGFTAWGSPSVPALQLFTLNDVTNLTNAGSPAVVTQLGCWNTYYASPRTESMGNRLLLSPDRGAAAVTGAATLTDDITGNDFGILFASRLAEPGQTLGNAWWLAKQDLAATANPERDIRDVLLGWTLLGDPALRVAP